MRITSFILIALIVLPAMLFILEWYLCKKEMRFALILPCIVACFFMFLGFIALILSAILFLIYFVMRHLQSEKRKSLSEIEKMNIQDLD